MYICPECNTTLDDSSVRLQNRFYRCSQGHRTKRVESYGMNLAKGVGITLAFFLGMGVVILFLPVQYADWKPIIAAVAILLYVGVGIAGIVEARKYASKPDPTSRLSSQIMGYNLGILATCGVLLLISVIMLMAK